MPETAIGRFMSLLKCRIVGGGSMTSANAINAASSAAGGGGGGGGASNSNASGDTNNYMRNISNDSANEQTTYIERIDDESTEHSDLIVNSTAPTKVMTASFSQTAPISIELPATGMHLKIFHKMSRIHNWNFKF